LFSYRTPPLLHVRRGTQSSMPTRFRRRFRNLSFGSRCSTERVGHQVSRRFRSFHTGPSCTVHQRFTGRFHVWEEEKEEKEEEQEEQEEQQQEEQEEQEERTQKHTTPISARTQQHTPSTPPTKHPPLLLPPLYPTYSSMPPNVFPSALESFLVRISPNLA